MQLNKDCLGCALVSYFESKSELPWRKRCFRNRALVLVLVVGCWAIWDRVGAASPCPRRTAILKEAFDESRNSSVEKEEFQEMAKFLSIMRLQSGKSPDANQCP